MDPLKIGFLGGGAMCEAILRGILSKNVVQPSFVWVSDVAESRLEIMRGLGVHATASSRKVVENSTIIILAVKPDTVAQVLGEVQDLISQDHLIVSICAGVPLQKLESLVAADVAVVRVMPNTPCLVGAAGSAYALGSNAKTETHAKLVEKIFGAVGLVVCVPEKLLDAVTGVSGSGPAYVFMFMEALADGGVCAGLPREVARKLACQTVYGAAKMALEQENLHLAELRNRVESPGGTTIAASRALETGGLRSTVINAVMAAAQRSVEMREKPSPL
jgi:pyrroline-5-carboxylate reductase